ncbi:AraC family transcriptional regulator [Streptomyces collinus]|uniref:AraC family transcriptional regulator n=1 Tax=Streptomyces collinus (strain DSM 40733 / Tue 365) TaxID=1214242 RepID=S5VKW2_STRC3|nr:AraC family transcriptional regulator [Streptomyces collinus]AGS71217.1 AraC family transcriptional regulator [Streptomyces collinus Tu 365]UJA09867.1 helix-turn-helix domain-containing protein [Streptomyces collinus]UJA15269.1 helix-turn-helix domain-containing protein [Streptomyces collinus]
MRSTTVPPGTPCLAPRAGEPPLHRLETAGPHAPPFAAGSFDEVGPLSRADRPHRHTFYEIVHITAGSATHVVDLARWPVRPAQLVVILPGQIHCWEDQRGLDGTLALFTEDFLVDHPEDLRLLRRLAGACGLDLSAEDDLRTGRLMAELAAEHRQRTAGYETVLRALLHVLVVRTARLTAPGSGPGPVPDPRRAPAPGEPVPGRTPAPAKAPASGAVAVPGEASALAEAFARLTARPETAAWSVRECAERLGVTAGHLTQAVRAATGRSPGRLLIEARVYRAQRLLAHTDLPVRQVAARVGITDPAYFCRFFRRETGSSPGDWRKHHSRHHQSIEAPGTRA